MKNYEKILLLEKKLIELEEMLDDPKLTVRCANCGAPIGDWDDVEFTGTELVLTHKCACGRYAELHHKIIYDKTVVIEEGTAANE